MLVANVFQPEKIPAGERLSVDRLILEANRLSGDQRALAVAGASEIAAHVAENARSGDVLLVMSNGGFDGVHDKILQALTG